MATCQRSGCDEPLTGRQTMYCSLNCVKRACDDRHRAKCPECGGEMNQRSGWPDSDHPIPQRCKACHRRQGAEVRRARVERVAAMYNGGMAVRQIARELGYGENSRAPEITEARRLGLIGYRHRGFEEAA